METDITAAEVKQRFEAVKAGYEADGPDGTVPGATHSPARYAVVTESLRGHGYFVNYAATLSDVETAAAANIDEGWQPVCYYDLHELAGPEPGADVGDLVEYEGSRYHVVHTEDDAVDGTAFQWLYLHPSSADPAGWVDACDRVDEAFVRILSRSVESDQRMPARYLVARIVTFVAFNTRFEPR